jgi:hypothetical protein
MKLKYLVFILSFLPSILCGQIAWTPFSSPTPEDLKINLIRSDNLSIMFDMEIPGMYEIDTVVDGSLYKRIQGPGMGVSE